MSVPDPNTRVEGLIAGQYDDADTLPVSAYDRLEKSDKAPPSIVRNAGWTSLNMKKGPLTKKTLRQAMQVVVNPSDMMLAAFSDPKFFGIDGALFPQAFVWHTEAGVTCYGKGDRVAASKLMEQAGYRGTPIRILTSQQYEFHYKIGEVATAYLEVTGFKVDLQVVDQATLTTRRADPKQWDIFITHSNFPGDPTTLNTITDSYPGWYVSDQKTKAVVAYLDATSQAQKFKAWETLQTVICDDAPLVKIGNFNALGGIAKGLTDSRPAYRPMFWNLHPRH